MTLRQIPGIYLLAGLLLATLAMGASYEPVLPKTSRTEKVIVVDIRQDLIAGGNKKFTYAHELVYTLTALQGLANQNNPEKVYFENVPTRIFFDQNDGGPGNATEEFIEDGLLPFPVERAKLDMRKKFPALSWMLTKYHDRIKGLILVPGISGPEYSVPAIAGARAAGVNACTFDGLLPVSRETYSYLQEEGISAMLVDDYRHMSNEEALRLSLDKWINHPKRTDKMIGFASEFASHSMSMNDYFVETGVFCYYLNHRLRAGSGKNKTQGPSAKIDPEELHALILGKGYYPPGTVAFGSVELPHAIKEFQKYGYTCVEGLLSNASVTASIPTVPERFHPAVPARAKKIEEEVLYLAFHGNDGDAIDFNFYPTTKSLRNDPARGEVPMGWKVNPYMIDLFPTLFEWYTKQQPELNDLIPSMNDGGPSDTEEGRDAWAQTLLNYFEGANGAFQTFHMFGNVQNGGPDQSRQLPYFYAFFGYQNNQPDITWIYEDGKLRSNFVGHGFATAEGLAELITKTADQDFSEKEPAFVLARLGYDLGRDINVRRGTLPVSMAKWVVEAIEKDPGFSRKVVLCRPSDLARTWIEYHKVEK